MTAQPKENWFHLETGPALVRTVSTRQQLSNTFRERQKSQHTTPRQQKSGLVLVTVSHLYPCSLVPFTNPWQTTDQTKMPILEFSVSTETLKNWQLICYILLIEHQGRPTQGVTHKRQHINNFPFRLFQNSATSITSCLLLHPPQWFVLILSLTEISLWEKFLDMLFTP